MNGSYGPVCVPLVTGLWVREFYVLLKSSEGLSGKKSCSVFCCGFSEKPALGGAVSSGFLLESAVISSTVRTQVSQPPPLSLCITHWSCLVSGFSVMPASLSPERIF